MHPRDDSAATRQAEDESLQWIVWATALGFAAVVVAWLVVAKLLLGFDPLFALTYAFTYGLLATIAALALAIVLGLLIVPALLTAKAIRAWRETRNAGAALQAFGFALLTVIAVGIAIEAALIAVAAGG